MTTFAIGLVTSNVMLVDSHAIVPRKADIAPEQVAGDRDAVPVPESILTSVDGVFNLYGRSLNVGPPVTLVPVPTGPAARRAEWFERIRDSFITGMNNNLRWWPDLAASDTARRRSNDVRQAELPNWWRVGSQIVAAAASGRNWSDSMTEAQIEACVVHYESIAKNIRAWYRLGIGMDLSASPATPLPTGQARIPLPIPGVFGIGGDRFGTQYADRGRVLTAAGAAYTDMFTLTSGVLTPRPPDYGWIVIPITTDHLPPGTFYDPENPS